MEFSFDLNAILPSVITKYNNDLQIVSYSSKCEELEVPSRFLGRNLEEHLCEIIDKLGAASAKAQALQSPITTSLKFQNSDHRLYILREDDGERGKVVGFLKTGPKHLYLLDESQQTHECTPSCVLDFYVHESRQRKGLGKILFEYMLQSEKKLPVNLAIDRPSEKFICFLERHYGLCKSLLQVNNFVIFEGFFESMDHSHISQSYLKHGMKGNPRLYPESSMKTIMNHNIKDPDANRPHSGKKTYSVSDDKSIFQDDISIKSGKKFVTIGNRSTLSEIFDFPVKTSMNGDSGDQLSTNKGLTETLDTIHLTEKEFDSEDQDQLCDKDKVEKYLDELNNTPVYMRECPTPGSDCQSEYSFQGSEMSIPRSECSGPLRSGKRRALHNHSPLW